MKLTNPDAYPTIQIYDANEHTPISVIAGILYFEISIFCHIIKRIAIKLMYMKKKVLVDDAQLVGENDIIILEPNPKANINETNNLSFVVEQTNMKETNKITKTTI